MLPINAFRSYSINDSKFNDEIPSLKLSDLQQRYRGGIKLSYMISTYNRKAQLSRSLETLCRQTFRELEVLINDDGSTQNIKELVDTFSPYLNIKYFFTPRTSWVSCPSKAYKRMLEHCSGDVIAIAHPEMMLIEDAYYYLYYGAKKILKDLVVYAHLDDYDVEPKDTDKFWVTLKPQFIGEMTYKKLDTINWHDDIKNIKNIPNFDGECGFAGKTNLMWKIKERCPWWFVGSAKRDDRIWTDMPIFEGHATLDMWLLNYRGINNYVDCNILLPKCFHQLHATSAVAPEGELQRGSTESIKGAMNENRSVV